MKEGMFIMGDCRIIVTIDMGVWHLSISKENEIPSYEEVKEARYKYLSNDIVVAEIFPPKEEFVNLHPYCRHLWQLLSFKL